LRFRADRINEPNNPKLIDFCFTIPRIKETYPPRVVSEGEINIKS